MIDMAPPDSPHETPVVALVVLKAASGEPFDANVPITVQNLDRFRPDAHDVQTVVKAFEDAGFDAGPLGGVSLSISASRERFEALFGVHLIYVPDANWRVDPGDSSDVGSTISGDADHSAMHALPLDQLPRDITQRVEAIVFEPPMELDNDAFGIDQ